MGNLASWHFSSVNSSLQHRSLSKKIEVQVPLKDLLEITRLLDSSNPDEIKQLSKSYVNEMVHLA